MATKTENAATAWNGKGKGLTLRSAGVIWTAIFGALVLFFGWMALSFMDLKESVLRLEEGQKRIELFQTGKYR